MYIEDDYYLPTPVTIILDRRPEDDGNPDADYARAPEFEATSPQYPGLTRTARYSEEAVSELIQAIVFAQPLSQEVIEALRDAGHSPAVIEAWDRVTSHDDRRYRYNADAAVSTLADYTQTGLPALTACEFFGVDIPPAEAAQVHAAGSNAKEVVAYRRASATERWWKWDFEIMPWLVAGFPYERGRHYVYHCSVEQATAWEPVVQACGISDDDLGAILRLGLTPEAVTAGFPLDRVALYADLRLTPERALAWDAKAVEHGIPDADLRDIIRAGLTLESIDEHVAAYAEDGMGVGDAARVLLALAGDPWSNSAGAGSEEPPF